MRHSSFLIAGALAASGAVAGSVEVLSVTGSVTREQAAQAQPLRAGERFEGAFALRSGVGGSAQLRLADGTILTIASESALSVPAALESPIELRHGGLKLLPASGYRDVQAAGYVLKSNGYLRLHTCDAPCADPAGLYGKSLSGEVIVEYAGGRSVIRNKPFYAASNNRRPTILAREASVLQDDARLEEANQGKARVAQEIAAGMEAYKRGDMQAAYQQLSAALEQSPQQKAVVYYLGLIALEQKDNATALRYLQRYTRDDPESARERNVGQLVTLLVTSQLQAEVQEAMKMENALAQEKPEPDTIAVEAFTNRGDPAYAPMAKGIAAMVITDLSKVPGLKVLERQKVQKLLDEISLGESGLVSQNSRMRAGRLVRAEKLVLGSFGVQGGTGDMTASNGQEQFEMENALIESVSSNALGGIKKSGEISAFFVAQKEMVFNTLVDLGIPLESLPLNVRKGLERFQTTNIAAFKMFSLGLNAQDEGKFAEAKEFFQKAAQLDPNFELAGELSLAMPSANVSSAMQLQAVLAAASRTASNSSKAQVEIDLSTAVALLSAGVNVNVTQAPSTSLPGANAQAPTVVTLAPRIVTGLAYSQNGVSVASTNEWMTTQVASDATGLSRAGDPAQFQASRGSATSTTNTAMTLSDGSTVNWGTWQSGSYTVTSQGVGAGNLGPQLQYVYGPATRDMPTGGSVTFTPTGGFLSNVTGNIGVDFLSRSITLNNLSFDIGAQRFVNLSGGAIYSSSIASGFFKGAYTGGDCTGCSAFSPTASVFTGNFMGKGAAGMLFSTTMSTGTGTAAGMHVFGR
jgi:tetratricopeptide (TPR) repeat protein/plastocyanin